MVETVNRLKWKTKEVALADLGKPSGRRHCRGEEYDRSREGKGRKQGARTRGPLRAQRENDLTLEGRSP